YLRDSFMANKINQKLQYLKKALLRLEEMINEPVSEKRAEIDSVIQRFEFCFELYWKTLQAILESLGENVAFPKEILQSAYKGGLIVDEKIWLAMLRDRNQTSHVYDEGAADAIYTNIKQSYAHVLASTFQTLEGKFYIHD
ncbi:MAG: HI0074 family nucleotidyltransferase substrate-binding subunit, partial [Pseudomonadota bacterium]